MQARILICLLTTLSTSTLAAPTIEATHATQCTSCHSSTVYTRPDRKVSSLAKLEGQVRACDVNLNLGWFDEEILGMTQYLNQQYYHFKP